MARQRDASDPETFLLKWKRTWPDKADDFTGRDPDDPMSFIRVYRQHATADPDRAWLWMVTIDQQRVPSGHAADGPEDARPAVRAGREGMGAAQGQRPGKSPRLRPMSGRPAGVTLRPARDILLPGSTSRVRPGGVLTRRPVRPLSGGKTAALRAFGCRA